MRLNTLAWRLAIILLFFIVLAWLLMPQEKAIQKSAQTTEVFQVTALKATPQTVQIHVKTTGITQARWPVEVTTSVSGRLVELAAESEPGSIVAADTLLAKLLDTSYVAQMKVAQANVKRAQLELAKFQHEQYVVKSVNNGKRVSAFGRFEPHVAAAEAEVESTQAQLLSAKQRLEDTNINAPFSAVILAKHVTPSQWLSAGDKLFSLASAEFVDIHVTLGQRQWQRLGDIRKQQRIKVTTPEGKHWQASVRFVSAEMDKTTRQRSMVLQVAEPYRAASPLLAGQQVDISFASTEEVNVVRAPASVLTQDGKVWSIKDGKFALEDVEVIDEDSKHILFRYRTDADSTRTLVKYPLGTMLVGQRAQAVFE